MVLFLSFLPSAPTPLSLQEQKQETLPLISSLAGFPSPGVQVPVALAPQWLSPRRQLLLPLPKKESWGQLLRFQTIIFFTSLLNMGKSLKFKVAPGCPVVLVFLSRLCSVWNFIIITNDGISLMVQWLRFWASNAGGSQVQSMVRKLRSHMPHSVAKKQNKQTTTTTKN